MPNTQCKKCRHGYIAEMCTKDHPSQIVPCTDVPACPVIKDQPEEFTHDELAIIRAGCLTACPMFPDMPMWEPWASIYEKSGRMMLARSTAELN